MCWPMTLLASNLGRCQADAAFVLRHDLPEGVVGVDHDPLWIGDEGAGRGLVQRSTNTQVFVGDPLIAFDTLFQVALHALHWSASTRPLRPGPAR